MVHVFRNSGGITTMSSSVLRSGQPWFLLGQIINSSSAQTVLLVILPGNILKVSSLDRTATSPPYCMWQLSPVN